MARIKVLPEILSNKIAAGEVIERPASVVKELLENALDAESTRILIDLKNAGKSLIRVTDNGCGMNRDDALLSMERYATSKIHTDKDLFEIKTLGFRGEALPSIASVSRFTLESRDADTDVGTRVLIEGGTLRDVTEIGCPVGTQITVQDLFFNTPARRKFLKSPETEVGHIADTVARIALAWPGVLFRLTHNGKTIKDWSAATAVDRAADVLGAHLGGSLFPLQGAYSGMQLRGWVAPSRLARNTSRGIYLYVNHRFVRDRMIQHALMEGYRNRLMKGMFPLAVLFLMVPADQVDVNVHPTKNEVRFADFRAVHQLVRTAVSATIETAEKPQWGRATEEAATVAGISEGRAKEPFSSPVIQKVLTPIGSQTRQPEAQEVIWRKKFFSDLRIIGQFRDTYILCESTEGELILIDQHAAHERIRYEELQEKQGHGLKDAQRLLIPETIDLGFEEAKILDRLTESLSSFGLEIESFGGTTYVVKTAPSLFIGKPVGPIIFELVEKMAEIGVGSSPAEPLDQIRKLLACHRSLRANQRLTENEIKMLLHQLDTCADPSHCPHGRPTYIRWALSEVEKAFRRVT